MTLHLNTLTPTGVFEEVVICSHNEGECSTSRNQFLTSVCMEEMRPPSRIFQCNQGHVLCEQCRSELLSSSV